MPIINTDRFTGFSELYDSVRPQPPTKVVDIVCHILGRKHIGSIVDLGSGTGLSTKIWTGPSNRVVGIEPTTDMIDRARVRLPEVTFLQANSYETTLEGNTIDLVVCSQAFHWMEPSRTLREVDRILKSAGLFVVLDCQWPVTWYWPAERAYSDLLKKARNVTESNPKSGLEIQQYPKEKHLENIKGSGVFVHCGSILFDNVEPCDGDRFLGIALSQGHVQDVLKHSPSELENEIQMLKEAVMNSSSVEMRVSYMMHYGIKHG